MDQSKGLSKKLLCIRSSITYNADKRNIFNKQPVTDNLSWKLYTSVTQWEDIHLHQVVQLTRRYHFRKRALIVGV